MPVVQIRIYGWKAEGKLARPFKVPNPFADLMGQGGAAAADDDDAQESLESKIELVKDSSSEAEGVELKIDSSKSKVSGSGSGVKSRKPRKEE